MYIFRRPYLDSLPRTVVTQTSIDCRMTIDLRERRFGRSGRIVASCSLDLSSAADQGELAHIYVKRGLRSCTVFVVQKYPLI
jgi:hypothetical protein